MGFVHDQHVEQRTVTLHHELFDHVHEVHLVGHLLVVTDHLIHDLQLLEVQTIVCVLFVEHLLHRLAGHPSKLEDAVILIALGLTCREQDAIVHADRSRREHGQTQQLTDLVVVRTLHDLLTTEAKVLEREGVQRTEPDHLLFVDAQLLRSTVPCFLCCLLAEGHESNLVGRRSTVQFLLDNVDQPCGLARAWGSEDRSLHHSVSSFL